MVLGVQSGRGTAQNRTVSNRYLSQSVDVQWCSFFFRTRPEQRVGAGRPHPVHHLPDAADRADAQVFDG